MMKKLFLSAVISLILISICEAQEKIYPAIQGYGAINPVPFETQKPDPSKQYKFVVEISQGIEKKQEASDDLDYASRMYNAHIYAGVPKENIDLVFVIYAGQTPVVLSNSEYEKRFHTANPNAKLLDELKSAGIRVIVCGQSMMKQNLVPEMLYPGVEMAVSRFTATTDLMLKGYLLFPL
jgi:intracellular sulfur oxidation DsrE/DsrF family protein